MKKIFVPVLALFVALFITGCGKSKEEGAPKAGMAQEFSATVVNKAGGHTITSRIYLKAGKFRMENKSAGGTYSIVRQDLNKVWTVMPASKSYLELSQAKDRAAEVPGEKMKGEVSRKAIGSETIDGHPTTKYEVTAKMGDKTITSHQWWATDISFPIKTAAVDGSWSVTYSDVKIGGQPDSLFELPAGYKKMSMPSMPGNIQGMLPGKGAGQ
jgi:hypothetical protein